MPSFLTVLGMIFMLMGCFLVVALLIIMNFDRWGIGKALMLRRWWPGWFRFYVVTGVFAYAMLIGSIVMLTATLGFHLGVLCLPIAYAYMLTAMVYSTRGAWREGQPQFTIELFYSHTSYEDRVLESIRLAEYLAERLSADDKRRIRVNAIRQLADENEILITDGNRNALVFECLRDDRDQAIHIHVMNLRLSSRLGKERFIETDNMLPERASCGNLYSTTMHLLKEIGIPRIGAKSPGAYIKTRPRKTRLK